MLEGDLRNLPLTDLLQLLASSRKDGTLRLDRSGASARLLMVEGRLVDAAVRPGPHLAEVLVRQEVLPFREVLELIGSRDEGALAGRIALLARGGAREGLARSLESFLLEVVAHLLDWRTGSFSFGDRGGWPPTVPAGGLDVGTALLRVGGGGKPPLARVSFRTAGDATKVKLPHLAWEILGFVDGRRTSEMVAAEAGLADWQAFRVLAELEALGIVERSPFEVEPTRVLVVTADHALARLLRQLLLRMRAEPVVVTSPTEALTVADRERLRAVVVDDMAGGGLPLVHGLRRSPGRTHLPAVLLQQAVETGLLARLRRPRALSLPKPFGESEFTSLLSRMVSPQAA